MRAFLAIGLAIGGAAVLIAQQPAPAAGETVDSHIAAARNAAGTDEDGMFRRLCDAVTAAPLTPVVAPAAPAGGRGNAPRQTPDRATWHAEPVKVFDNLYWLGQTEFSVWAVTTSQGIVVIDTIFDYSVEDEVVGGLKKLGLDPAQIKYAIVSHGHGDHSGGAKYLQDHFGTRILLSAADWDLLERTGGPAPSRDMVVTDGQKLTLGDTTLTMYLTPGHTAGTISTIFPVKDGGSAHTAAIWGGTMFNWLGNGRAYITPATPTSYWFKLYSDSASRFRTIATPPASMSCCRITRNSTVRNGSCRPWLLVASATPPRTGTANVARYLTSSANAQPAGRAKFDGK